MNRALASLAIGAILLAGCSPRNQTATTNSDSTQMAERSEREHEVAARLDSTRARLDSLKSEAAVLGNKVNSATTAKIAELEVEKDSAQSYFVQLADLNAYAAYRMERPDPLFPQGMWNELGSAILRDANKYHQHENPGIVRGPR